MRKLLLLLAAVTPLAIWAQTNTISGYIEESTALLPALNTTVFFTKGDSAFTTITDENGKFMVELGYGQYRIDFRVDTTLYTVGTYEVGEKPVNLGTIQYTANISVLEDKTIQENIPTISLGENDLKDDGAQNVSSALNASRDVFVSTASFVLSGGRFRVRGYSNENVATYMNGVPVNDVEDGSVFWGQWGGLNNVLYNRETTIGLQATTFAFGSVGGASIFDTRASKQRKQFQVSYAATNRNYRNRLMATYSTGMLKKGWAVSLSASRRWAAEGYVPGTFYDSYSYYGSVEKYFGTNQSLAFTVLGAPTRTGRQSPTVQEMYDLAGSHYYNPNWGYQNGKKRNARISETHQPMFFLTHEWKINGNSNWTNSACFTFGKNSLSGLDWYNAKDPRPDYYSNLPSYLRDSSLKQIAMEEYREDINKRQINWDALYDANSHNYETVDSVDGIAGNTYSGNRATYILQRAVEYAKKFDFASTFNHTFNDHIALTAGLTYQMQITHYYREVVDLLGADYFVDINQFAERDFRDSAYASQNDLNHPNRIVKEGDNYGYNYETYVHRPAAWAQGVFKFNHIDVFAAAELSSTSFWRVGKARVGLFPNDSYGKSDVHNFFNYAFKAGITYKVNGRNYLFLNAAHMTRAPYFGEAFVSPRTRNQVVDNLKNEVVYSAEAGYQLRTPRFKLKVDMFFSQFNDQTKTYTFYDGDARTLVNYTLTGTDTRHWGAELGMEWKVYKGFTATAVASLGRYTYTSRPDATVTQDNIQTVIKNETIYAKGFNVGSTPQAACSFGINYRDPKFWFVSVNFNYYDWMWVDFNPARRTINAVAPLEDGSTEWNKVIDQERLKGQFTMDLYAGYSWLLNNQFKDLKKRYYLVFNVGISNITNNRNFVVSSYEQLRFDYRNNDVTRFASKYAYAYGTTYFINLTFRMN